MGEWAGEDKVNERAARRGELKKRPPRNALRRFLNVRNREAV